MDFIEIFNTAVMVIFFVCYSYQSVYLIAALLSKPRPHRAEQLHRIAVLIAARNEQSVIGNLIDSIRAQDYPQELLDIYVGADNCTDATAEVARQHGATVFERKDSIHAGKGHVLSYLLEHIRQTGAVYDAYTVFDADNILDRGFIRALNRVYTDGYEVVTCYRNSKNYGDNMLSAGSALWFLRESRYLNGARMALGVSCAVSGTGFLFSQKILDKCGGWNYFLLTEDIEFSAVNILSGEKIGYAEDAILYDEQPTGLRQFWRQRVRWAKGTYQVFRRYGLALVRGMLRGSLSCFDIVMNNMPAAILSGLSAVVNLGTAIYRCAMGGSLAVLGQSLLRILLGLCLTMFLLGVLTTATEWRHIHCPAWKKLLYILTFPLFMLLCIPAGIASLFSRAEWKPIIHSRNVTLKQINEEDV